MRIWRGPVVDHPTGNRSIPGSDLVLGLRELRNRQSSTFVDVGVFGGVAFECFDIVVERIVVPIDYPSLDCLVRSARWQGKPKGKRERVGTDAADTPVEVLLPTLDVVGLRTASFRSASGATERVTLGLTIEQQLEELLGCGDVREHLSKLRRLRA